jgi:hypothetical protein
MFPKSEFLITPLTLFDTIFVQVLTKKLYLKRLSVFSSFAAPEQCQLNCRADGHRFYATLNQTVVDGTSCWPPPKQHQQRRPAAERWVCVSGECKVRA